MWGLRLASVGQPRRKPPTPPSGRRHHLDLDPFRANLLDLRFSREGVAVSERDEKPSTSRRDFLKKLGVGAAVVSAPTVLAACNPYHWG
jgi:hypothetical protein